MTWDDALAHCFSEHTNMAQIQSKENLTEMMNTPAGGYTGKVWIGLFDNVTNWTWVNGKPATYFNWESGQPDGMYNNELCVAMTAEGSWIDESCSAKRHFVCDNGGGEYEGSRHMLTWSEAKAKCEEKSYTLVNIPGDRVNTAVHKYVSGAEESAWIGLHMPKDWFWSEPEEGNMFTNWNKGQPDNLKETDNCAAVALTDGTWTDELCNVTLPFFCFGIYKSQKTVVKVKIQSSANMEDPACSADLLQQLRTTLANQGVTDFKLTWKKLPMKQKQQSSETEGFSLSFCSHFPLREYHYVDVPMTWADAQQYCRTKYTDLATITSMDDINRLQPTFSYSWAWIGLRDDPMSWKVTIGNDTNSWRWSATGETSKTGYQNWDTNEPANSPANEYCVGMNIYGRWFDANCNTQRTFVCYTEINQTEKTYVFISARRTWADARDYCREHHTDLPMMESNEDNNKVYSTIPAGAQAWIGLYRLPWTWSDKTQSSFRFWQSGSPNNIGGSQFCASENTNHEWDDDHCLTKYPFICHQVLKLKTTVKMTFKTDADITDPAANAQILQQLGALLESQGLTNIRVRWTIQPRKEEKEKPSEPHCIIHF
ncbi:hypothetical protein ABVT39_025028 [Epinephelus coioides]